MFDHLLKDQISGKEKVQDNKQAQEADNGMRTALGLDDDQTSAASTPCHGSPSGAKGTTGSPEAPPHSQPGISTADNLLETHAHPLDSAEQPPGKPQGSVSPAQGELDESMPAAACNKTSDIDPLIPHKSACDPPQGPKNNAVGHIVGTHDVLQPPTAGGPCLSPTTNDEQQGRAGAEEQAREERESNAEVLEGGQTLNGDNAAGKANKGSGSISKMGTEAAKESGDGDASGSDKAVKKSKQAADKAPLGVGIGSSGPVDIEMGHSGALEGVESSEHDLLHESDEGSGKPALRDKGKAHAVTPKGDDKEHVLANTSKLENTEGNLMGTSKRDKGKSKGRRQPPVAALPPKRRIKSTAEQPFVLELETGGIRCKSVAAAALAPRLKGKRTTLSLSSLSLSNTSSLSEDGNNLRTGSGSTRAAKSGAPQRKAPTPCAPPAPPCRRACVESSSSGGKSDRNQAGGAPSPRASKSRPRKRTKRSDRIAPRPRGKDASAPAVLVANKEAPVGKPFIRGAASRAPARLGKAMYDPARDVLKCPVGELRRKAWVASEQPRGKANRKQSKGASDTVEYNGVLCWRRVVKELTQLLGLTPEEIVNSARVDKQK
ncbi:uncharacterized protein JCM10292_007673 [Rhodotorula paludigena]|uniref:uncharacterized protein n=1 Tax=Rhodotorula paludigena TaxID=86838 RepID=UPI00316C1606